MKAVAPKNFMRGAMALVLLVAFMVGLFWVLNYSVPEGNQQLVVYMLGQLSVFAGMPIAYYFGSVQGFQKAEEQLLLPPPGLPAQQLPQNTRAPQYAQEHQDDVLELDQEQELPTRAG